MADFDAWDVDGEDARGGGSALAVNGGLLDPRTFPWRWAPLTDYPSVEPQAPAITGPMRTSVDDEVLQDILNAQARLRGEAKGPRVKPHPETWSINGRTYYGIDARNFDPARSSGVTAMQTPADDAAAWADMSKVAVPMGIAERAGYIAHAPSKVVVVRGRAGGVDGDTFTFRKPVDATAIHGHIDRRPPQPGDLFAPSSSDGFVDDIEEADGYGDTDSLRKIPAVPTATVSHSQVGWHILDNGQLKFLYPPGSMTPFQIGKMQANLDQEQQKFLRPK